MTDVVTSTPEDSTDHNGAHLAPTGQTRSGMTADALRGALQRRLGDHEQLPPRVSALRRDGKRMYDLVRAGEDVDAHLEPRTVTAEALALESYY